MAKDTRRYQKQVNGFKIFYSDHWGRYRVKIGKVVCGVFYGEYEAVDYCRSHSVADVLKEIA